jgi:hypothetical protein
VGDDLSLDMYLVLVGPYVSQLKVAALKAALKHQKRTEDKETDFGSSNIPPRAGRSPLMTQSLSFAVFVDAVESIQQTHSV